MEYVQTNSVMLLVNDLLMLNIVVLRHCP